MSLLNGIAQNGKRCCPFVPSNPIYMIVSRKAYTNKRNMLRHKRTCKNSLDKLQPQECLQLRENSTPCIT